MTKEMFTNGSAYLEQKLFSEYGWLSQKTKALQYNKSKNLSAWFLSILKHITYQNSTSFNFKEIVRPILWVITKLPTIMRYCSTHIPIINYVIPKRCEKKPGERVLSFYMSHTC